MRIGRCLLALLTLLLPATSLAQTVESAGSRALGMAGAFVAIANDSSATWWNPAGIAAGPFLDMGLSRAVTEVGRDAAAPWRSTASSFALATPVVGVSFYRFRTTDADSAATTATGGAGRQANRTGVPVRSVPASQLGLTLAHTVVAGVHVGATFKYVHGKVLTGSVDGTADDLLEAGEALEGGDGESHFDLDAGVLATAGALRFGAMVRNVLETTFGDPDAGPVGTLPRQARVGAAFDGELIGLVPLTIAVDVDVLRYSIAAGDRRVVALGAEQWLFEHRLGVRGGARFNTVDLEERAGTAGVSVAIRSGLFVDGHIVRGGAENERGWGAAARVSF